MQSYSQHFQKHILTFYFEKCYFLFFFLIMPKSKASVNHLDPLKITWLFFIRTYHEDFKALRETKKRFRKLELDSNLCSKNSKLKTQLITWLTKIRLIRESLQLTLKMLYSAFELSYIKAKFKKMLLI